MRNLIILSAITSLLVGCGSLGNSDYSCPGRPTGVMCKSAAEVYAMTGGAHASIGSEPGEGSTAEQANGGLPGRLLEPLAIPMPIMEPAQVQRIWIAPWQDASGDLNWPSHVFTEVTPRRWHIGEKTAVSAPIIAPVEMPTQPEKQDEEQKQTTQPRPHDATNKAIPTKGMP